MIALITGTVVHLSAPFACIMTQGGVGYEVELPLSSFCQLQDQEQVRLWTHLVVREDGQFLCAFVQQKDRDAFRKLIKISGVGTKMALAMLSAFSAGELHQIIEQNQEDRLTQIPGVGKKTAQRLLIELKGKLDEFAQHASLSMAVDNAASKVQADVVAEVESALLSLGYKEKEAKDAVLRASTALDEPVITTQLLLKHTLKQLAKF